VRIGASPLWLNSTLTDASGSVLNTLTTPMTQNDNRPASDGDGAPSGAVLLVEDEVLIRLLLADELRSAGAVNADEALGVASDLKISLLLTNFAMPGSMNGLQLAAEVRRQHPDLPIILVSAYSAPPTDTWINALFRKPYKVEAVIKAIYGLVRRAPPSAELLVSK
jgi:two-component system, response regulator PdtaR